jgi:Uma2 family endonuclease
MSAVAELAPPASTPVADLSARPAQFPTAAEWYAALGEVPLNRILFDPPPGTATEADLLRYVERDKRLCELADGTLVEKAMGWEEGLVEVRISTIVSTFVAARQLGAVVGASGTIRLLPSKVRLPDVAFYTTQTLAARPKGVPVPAIVPDLAVEVISPGNTPKEMALKLAEYFEAGTRLVWYVDPKSRTVDVHTSPEQVTRLAEADTITGGDVLPGFASPVAAFFEGL